MPLQQLPIREIRNPVKVRVEQALQRDLGLLLRHPLDPAPVQDRSQGRDHRGLNVRDQGPDRGLVAKQERAQETKRS